MRLRALCLSLPLLMLASLAPNARAQAQDSFDALVPKDTVLFVSLTNLKRTRERLDASAFHGLWKDAAMQAFTAPVRKQWEKAMESAKSKAGITPEELLTMLDGEVALALRAGPEGSDRIRLLLLADVGEKGDKLREAIQTAENSMLEEEGVRRLEEEFRGVTIVEYRQQEACGEGDGAGEGGSEDGAPTCWCMDGSLLVISESVETLRDFLATRDDSDTEKLDAYEPYRRVLTRTGERTDITFYMGMEALWSALQGAGVVGENEARIAQALGAMGVDAAAARLSLAPHGLAFDMFMSIPGKKEGMLKLFDAENSGLRPPAFVGQDSTAATTWSIDLPGLWAEFRRIANTLQPGMLADVDAGIEFFKGASGVDLQTDLIGALGTEITYYIRPSAPKEVEAAGEREFGLELPSLVVAISIADHAKIDGAFNAITAMAQGMIREEEYLGFKVRKIALPLPIAPAFAITPDQLFFALTENDLKDVLARAGKEVKSLRDTEEYQRAVSHLPGNVTMVGFTREADGTGQSFLASFLMGFSNSFAGAEPFDPASFPSTEILQKYLDVGGSSMSNEEDGIHVRYVLLTKSE